MYYIFATLNGQELLSLVKFDLRIDWANSQISIYYYPK